MKTTENERKKEGKRKRAERRTRQQCSVGGKKEQAVERKCMKSTYASDADAKENNNDRPGLAILGLEPSRSSSHALSLQISQLWLGVEQDGPLLDRPDIARAIA